MAEVHGLNPTEPPQDAADGLGLKQDFNSSGTCRYICCICCISYIRELKPQNFAVVSSDLRCFFWNMKGYFWDGLWHTCKRCESTPKPRDLTTHLQFRNNRIKAFKMPRPNKITRATQDKDAEMCKAIWCLTRDDQGSCMTIWLLLNWILKIGWRDFESISSLSS